MAIEVSENNEQQKLEVVSREERLESLFNLDAEIESLQDELEAEKERAKGAAADLKGQIKEKQMIRKDLMFKLNNRQETFVPVTTAANTDDEEDGEGPTDEDLAAYGEPGAEGETETPEEEEEGGDAGKTAPLAEEPENSPDSTSGSKNAENVTALAAPKRGNRAYSRTASEMANRGEVS